VIGRAITLEATPRSSASRPRLFGVEVGALRRPVRSAPERSRAARGRRMDKKDVCSRRDGPAEVRRSHSIRRAPARRDLGADISGDATAYRARTRSIICSSRSARIRARRDLAAAATGTNRRLAAARTTGLVLLSRVANLANLMLRARPPASGSIAVRLAIGARAGASSPAASPKASDCGDRRRLRRRARPGGSAASSWILTTENNRLFVSSRSTADLRLHGGAWRRDLFDLRPRPGDSRHRMAPAPR